MKKIKFLNLAVALMLATSQAFGASIGDDNVDLGKPTSTSDKSVTFKGPTSSKKLKGTQAGALSYDGNSFLLGDGANTANKILQFNKGGSSPFFQYNFSTGAIDTGNLSILNHTGNTLNVGDAANTNKTLKFNKGAGSPEIRYNSTNSKLEFTNDGSVYRSIGSGAGGGSGINLLDNPGFEDGIAVNWSNTGGTYAAAIAPNILYQTTSVAFTPSAGSQFFESQAVVIPPVLYGQKCMVKIAYTGADANVYLTPMDGTGTELVPTSARAVANASGGTKALKVYFDCPASGSMKMRVQSTASGAIGYYDEAVMGQADSVQTKTPSMLGSSRWAPATNCVWTTSGGSAVGPASSFTTLALDNDCSNPVLKGNAISVGSKVPAIRFATAQPGIYKVTINGRVQETSNSSVWAIWDGASVGSSRQATNFSYPQTSSAVMTSIFEYSTVQSNLTFSPIVNFIAGSPTGQIINDETTQEETAFEIFVEYFPLAADTVVNGKCPNASDCENIFTADMTAAGLVSNENLDWLNGNCTFTSSGFTCPFNAGFFGVTPNCWGATSEGGAASTARNFTIDNTQTNTSQLRFYFHQSGVGNVASAGKITCQRAGADFKIKQEIKGFFSSTLNPISFYAYSTSGQSIPNGADTTVVMNAEGYDTANAHDTATGTFTVPETGKYQCYCLFTYVSANYGVSTLQSGITVNGSLLASKFYTTAAVVNPQSVDINSANAYVQGDQVRCLAFQNTGTSRALSTTGPYSTFTCSKVGN